MTVTDEQREAWQALADAATKGPWEVNGFPGHRPGVYQLTDDDQGGTWATEQIVDPVEKWADAEFIAAARTAVPALLAALRDAEAERDAWRMKALRHAEESAEKGHRLHDAEATIARVRDALLPHEEGHADRDAMDPLDCGPEIIDDIRAALDGGETKETPALDWGQFLDDVAAQSLDIARSKHDPKETS